METRTRLRVFREDRGLTHVEIGRALGCGPSHAALLERGTRRPGLAVAFALEDLTAGWRGGAIKARDWVAERKNT